MKLKGLYKLPHSGIWYYQPPQVGGVRPKPINLRTKDEETAVKLYHDAVNEARRVYAGGSVRMEAARYLDEKSRRGEHTIRTTEAATIVLERFANHCGNRPLATIVHDDVASFHLAMIEAGKADSTIRAELGRLNGFFTWAVTEASVLRTHPGKKIKRPKAVATRTERYCTKEERDRLLAAAAVERDYRPKRVVQYLPCYLWLGFMAGLRKSEIVEARRDWIDLTGGVIHVRETDTFVPKDKQARKIRMSPRLCAFMTAYLERTPAGPHPYLLRPDIGPGKKRKARGKKAWRYRFDPKKTFKSLMAEEDLEWVTNHAMRHTFATLHIIGGTPLGMVAKELGDDESLVFKTYVGYSRSSGHESVID